MDGLAEFHGAGSSDKPASLTDEDYEEFAEMGLTFDG